MYLAWVALGHPKNDCQLPYEDTLEVDITGVSIMNFAEHMFLLGFIIKNKLIMHITNTIFRNHI